MDQCSLDPVLNGELVFLPSNHFTVGMSGVIMSRPSKRPPMLLQPRELSELIFDTDSDEGRVSNEVSSMWIKRPTRCHFLALCLFLLYSLLNMFRATLCPSSGAGDLEVFIRCVAAVAV